MPKQGFTIYAIFSILPLVSRVRALLECNMERVNVKY